MKYLRNNNIFFGLFIIAMVVAMIGCSTEDKGTIGEEQSTMTQNYPLEIADDSGSTVIIKSKPLRIISLAPSHTEILYALGLGENVVGVTEYCDFPEKVKDKPKVGDSFSIDMERVLELDPDIVIQYWGMEDELKKQLNNAGIAIITLSPESINQTLDTIRVLGLVTDTEAKAEEIISQINEKKQEIADKVKGAPRTKVFYEIEYSSALWTAGEGSFIDEIITLGGGENIAKDAQGPYAQYSVEALIEKDPEIYVTNTFNMELQSYTNIKDRPGFEAISAVKDGRIEILDGNILSRPSQRIIIALELMAKAIHPELFK